MPERREQSALRVTAGPGAGARRRGAVVGRKKRAQTYGACQGCDAHWREREFRSRAAAKSTWPRPSLASCRLAQRTWATPPGLLPVIDTTAAARTSRLRVACGPDLGSTETASARDGNRITPPRGVQQGVTGWGPAECRGPSPPARAPLHNLVDVSNQRRAIDARQARRRQRLPRPNGVDVQAHDQVGHGGAADGDALQSVQPQPVGV